MPNQSQNRRAQQATGPTEPTEQGPNADPTPDGAPRGSSEDTVTGELLAAFYTDQDGTRYERGDEVTLPRKRAEQFITSGVIKDPNGATDAPEPGGETTAPE